MIFASVGTMMPFDRFAKAIDEWGAAHPQQNVFLQIGNGQYEPRHVEWTRLISPEDYRNKLKSCDLFIAHVGMGSILQALEFGKQALLLPRKLALGEHNTDHQLHTASRFRNTAGIRIADDEIQLQQLISEMLSAPKSAVAEIASFATPKLVGNINAYLRK